MVFTLRGILIEVNFGQLANAQKPIPNKPSGRVTDSTLRIPFILLSLATIVTLYVLLLYETVSGMDRVVPSPLTQLAQTVYGATVSLLIE